MSAVVAPNNLLLLQATNTHGDSIMERTSQPSKQLAYYEKRRKCFRAILKGVRENDPETMQLYASGDNESVSETILERMTEEEWEDLGRNILIKQYVFDVCQIQ